MSEPTTQRTATSTAYDHYKAVIDDGKALKTSTFFKDGKRYDIHMLIKDTDGTWMKLSGLSTSPDKINALAKLTFDVHQAHTTDFDPSRVAYIDKEGLHFHDTDTPQLNTDVNMKDEHHEAFEKATADENNTDPDTAHLEYMSGFSDSVRDVKNENFNKEVHRLANPSITEEEAEADFVTNHQNAEEIKPQVFETLNKMSHEHRTAMHAWIALSKAVENVWEAHQSRHSTPDLSTMKLVISSEDDTPVDEFITSQPHIDTETGDVFYEFPRSDPEDVFYEFPRSDPEEEVESVPQSTLEYLRNTVGSWLPSIPVFSNSPPKENDVSHNPLPLHEDMSKLQERLDKPAESRVVTIEDKHYFSALEKLNNNNVDNLDESELAVIAEIQRNITVESKESNLQAIRDELYAKVELDGLQTLVSDANPALTPEPKDYATALSFLLKPIGDLTDKEKLAISQCLDQKNTSSETYSTLFKNLQCESLEKLSKESTESVLTKETVNTEWQRIKTMIKDEDFENLDAPDLNTLPYNMQNTAKKFSKEDSVYTNTELYFMSELFNRIQGNFPLKSEEWQANILCLCMEKF